MESVIVEQPKKSILSLNSILWGMVFLFPVLAVSVKSWTSAIHLLLAIASIIWLVKNYRLENSKLTNREKIFLVALILEFLWYLLSEYANGWQGIKAHWPLIDFRYVLIIPIYLTFRLLAGDNSWLLKGAIVGCIFASIITSYQSFYLNETPPMGAYHHLFLGPASAALSLLILYSNPKAIKNKLWRNLAYVAIVCGMLSLILSTARSGFLATFILLLLFPLLTGRLSFKRLSLYLVILSICTVSLYYLSGSLRIEINDTVKGLHSHIQQLSLSKKEFHQSSLDNITIRFELWRVAWEISRENLMFGVGRTGYPRILSEMIANGDAHPQLGVIDQPHNAYLYHLVTRGVIGLSLFLAILAVPLFIFLSYWKEVKIEARLGVVWVLFFSIVSLTQSSVIARGHYLSFFLVVLTILLSSCISRSNRTTATDG